MVQGGMSCIKYLMLVFNFVFVICGIALVVIGAAIHKLEFTFFLNSKYQTAPIILIIVGCVIFVLAFLGCCGAVKENRCMVITFGILLFLVFVTEIAVGITAYVNYDGLDYLERKMKNSIEQDIKDAMKVWDDMQIDWKCCGVLNATDWPASRFPASCCPQDLEVCTALEAYDKGCYDTLLHKIKDIIRVVGGVSIGIGVVEFIGLVFSCCLVSAIKKEYKGVKRFGTLY